MGSSRESVIIREGLFGHNDVPYNRSKTGPLSAMSKSIKDLSLSPLIPIDFRWIDSSKSDSYNLASFSCEVLCNHSIYRRVSFVF